MRPAFSRRTLAVCLGLLVAAAAHAAPAPDPLRLVPDQADFFVEVKQPRKLVEALKEFGLYKQLQTLPQAREFFESTNYHRFLQLVAYYEKELGAPWPELIDKLAGGGIVLAGKFGQDPAPAVLVIQGSDARLTKQFFDLALQVIEQELARQESKEKFERGNYRGVDAAQIGDNAFAAVVESALVFSNNKKAMQAVLDLNADGPDKSLAKVADVAAAARLLPPRPWANLW